MWSGIIKNSMSSGLFYTYLDSIEIASSYTSTGAPFDLVKLRKRLLIVPLYLFRLLMIQLLFLAWRVRNKNSLSYFAQPSLKH